MHNTTANPPVAQDPLMLMLAMRCLRIAQTEGAEAARREFEACCWNYKEYDIAAELAALIAALAVD